MLPDPIALAALVVGGGIAVPLLVADRSAGSPPWLAQNTLARVAARWLSLAFLVVAVAGLGPRTDLADGGSDILRAELAFSQKKFDAIENTNGLATAVHWDFAFIPAYILLLALLAAWLGAFYRLDGVRSARRVVVLAVVAAGLLDVVENVAMLREWWPVAATAAWGKFAILVIAAAYVGVGFLSCLTTPRWLTLQLWQPLKPKASEDESAVPPSPAGLGIALSGGGIRAASLSLGALQTLERHSSGRLGDPIGWGRATAVTAVSGGSNIASGWSISRSWTPADDKKPPGWTPASPGTVPWSRAGEHVKVSPEERHLMDNLGYLLSNNPRADEGTVVARQPVRPTVFAIVLAGFLLNVTLLLTALWLVVRPLGWMFGGYSGWQGGTAGNDDFLLARTSLVVPALSYVAIGLAALLLWVAVGQWLSSGSDTKKVRRAILLTLRGVANGSLALGALLVAVLVVFPLLMFLTALAKDAQVSVIAVVGGLGSLGGVVRVLRKPAARYLPMLGGVVFLLVVLFLAAYWAAAAADDRDHLRPDTLWWVALGVLAFIYVVISPEQWSLAAFYRGKLRLAYALYRTGDTSVRPFQNSNITDDKTRWEPELHEIPTGPEAEYGTPLVICATATTSSRQVRTHYNIPAMSVTFDPDQVRVFVPRDDHGEWGKYEADTKAYAALGGSGKRLTTMLAVAIASAAVSPAMGRFRIGPTSMLLTFANVRLGVWMPHPAYAAASAAAGNAKYPRTRLSYLLKEFFGIHDVSDPYLYMTDGGHWENTGLVELLRRQDIKEVICVDADSGPGDATGSISKAIDLAALECGVRVHLNLDPLRAKLAGTRAPDYCKRNVNLGFYTRTTQKPGQGDEPPSYGVLWYTKPGLTQEMPAGLLAYRELNASYPRIGTVDQFFDTATYVAYRDLGRYNAGQVRLARVELIRLLDEVAKLPDATAVWNYVAGSGHGDPDVAWVRDELQSAIEVFGGREKAVEFCAAVRTSLLQPLSSP